MIYKFNEYKSEEKRLPTKVSRDEFFKKRSLHKMEDFTTREREIIRKITSERKKEIRCSFSSDFVEIYTSYQEVEIIKFTDDWFTIINIDRIDGTKFYTCDEFEEVESYLRVF